MLHDAGNEHRLAVADGVDLDLLPLEVLIDEDGFPPADLRRRRDVADELAGVLHDLHRPPAQDVAGAHEHRVADDLRGVERFLDAVDARARRLGDTQAGEELLEPSPVFRQVDGLRARSDDRHRSVVQRGRQVHRRLTAELHDGRRRLAASLGAVPGLVLENVPHRLFVQGLEVQPVARVEVGGHGFGVRIDHHRLIASVAQRPRRVHRCVVELDPLSDADGPAADDQRLVARPRRRLVFLLVRAVEVRRRGLEFARAGVDHLVHRADAPALPQLPHLLGQAVGQRGDLLVRKAHPLGSPEELRSERLREQAPLHGDDVRHLPQEPGVDARA